MHGDSDRQDYGSSYDYGRTDEDRNDYRTRTNYGTRTDYDTRINDVRPDYQTRGYTRTDYQTRPNSTYVQRPEYSQPAYRPEYSQPGYRPEYSPPAPPPDPYDNRGASQGLSGRNDYNVYNQRGNSSNCIPKCFAEKGSMVRSDISLSIFIILKKNNDIVDDVIF